MQVTFATVAGTPQATKALTREWFVLEYHALHAGGLGKEAALQAACNRPHPDTGATMSPARLREWLKRYAVAQLDGLVEQKRGVVGRRSAWSKLSDEQQNAYAAGVLEHGSHARAFRQLTVRHDLSADARLHVHQAHHSKSHVPSSVRRDGRPAPLTASLAQGPRAARLAGRFTPGAYDTFTAGEVFTADDMTSNVLCWVEWPNARGWKIAQAQLLPVLDVGSLRWLNVRVIVREGGQYSADDIWGLFGDTFDRFGLPARGFLLEGGHWQANRIAGHRGEKTGLTEDDRLGGLRALGLEMHRSYDPRSKHIETCFNQLQWQLDACPGYAGRDQRKQLPEALKKKLGEAEGGHIHPRDFLLHVTQLADRVREAMAALNDERNDGVICRGATPNEKWANDAASTRLRVLPDQAKWLYRSAMDLVKVTRNGLRITRGSGPKRVTHYWDNGDLLTPIEGRNVVVYWNDGTPTADACVLDPQSRKFLGLAHYVAPVNRFDGTDEQLSDEAARKREAMHYSRTELRTLTPFLSRRAPVVSCHDLPRVTEGTSSPVSVDRTTAAVGEELRDALARTEERTAERQSLAARVRALPPGAMAELLDADPRERTREPERDTVDLLSELA